MRRLAWPAALAALTLALYAPALGYGLIWDDPLWYGQAAGKSLGQLFFGLETYQFYRPLSLLLNQQFVTADGRIDAVAAHAVQLFAHLAAVLLLGPALRALGLRRRHSDVSALAFALYPAAFQAVAWQAPQGPWVLALSLAAITAAGRYAQGRRLWLAPTALAFAAALLFQESALPLGAFVIWAGVGRGVRGEERGARSSGRDTRLALRSSPFALRSLLLLASTAAIALAYLIIWLNVPREANVTGQGRDPRVLAYGLQAVAWPVARALAGSLTAWGPLMLAVSFGAVALALAGLLAARGYAGAALLGLAWVGAGLLPPYVGLSWEYVSYGERLTYVIAPGMAVLWAGLGAWLMPDVKGPPSALRGLPSIGLRLFAPPTAALALTLYAGLALAQVRDFHRLYAAGAAQLARSTTALTAEPEARLLFINFPDRYELRAPYYPLGFWGIVLAPVVQDLRDFAVAAEGVAGVDVSRAAFVTGALEREAWPYRVDLRGVNAGPEELVDEALPAARVLLTDFLPGGGLALRDVGDVAEDAGDAGLATSGGQIEEPAQAARVAFGGMVALRGAERGPAGLLELRWAALRQPDRDAAVFIHLWRDGAFVTDIGGDALGGLLPVWAWRPGALIIDRRALPPELVAVPGLSIRVGLYNRVTGERYALEGAEGEDEAFVIAD